MSQLIDQSGASAAMSSDLQVLLDQYIDIINAEIQALDSSSSGAAYLKLESDLEVAVGASLNNVQRDLIAQGFLDHSVARGWTGAQAWYRSGVGTAPKLNVVLPAAGVPVPSL